MGKYKRKKAQKVQIYNRPLNVPAERERCSISSRIGVLRGFSFLILLVFQPCTSEKEKKKDVFLRADVKTKR